MPPRLPPNLKQIVIDQWLQGKPRDTIAKEINLSAGAVTNFINEWRNDIGQYKADDLRELATSLKKAGITPSQCAIGFRLSSIMSSIGVIEDNFEIFLKEVYEHCKDKSLPMEKVAAYLYDLLSFSENHYFSEIPHYLNQKKEEKLALDQEIEKINDEIETLKKEKELFQMQREKTLEDKKITDLELAWYIHVKEELNSTEYT